jgi:hypothetical protein
LRSFLRILKWSYKNDFVEPFPEIVLFLGIVLIASNSFLDVTGTTNLFVSLTWKSILIIVIFVGIGGIRGYSLALEKGEITRQMLTLQISRTKFIFLKWLSLFAIFFAVLLSVDVVAFFVYLGYFPSFAAYALWSTAPVMVFALMLAEQVLLLIFLNSLVMLISFATRRTTVALLVFLAFTLFSAMPLSFVSSGIPNFLQLGYGDYTIVNGLSSYIYDLLYRPSALAAAASPTMEVYVALIYRVLAGLGLFALALQVFKGVDID